MSRLPKIPFHAPLRRFILFIVLTAPMLLTNLPAQHVPGIKWKQRETKNFLIIYPESLSDDAAALSMVLDEVFMEVSADLPPKHRKKKWPLVLTDLGLVSNGYVSLLPRRSVWYATPGEDFTAVSDWWMLLAHHEGRHLAHFDAADQGFTHFLRVLFGDLGWGTGLVFGSPPWLLEGDSVYLETELSKEGRGRDPLFTQEMAIIAAEDPDIKYHEISNFSYKKHHPSVYHLGYSLISWIRQQYGDEAMREIYTRTARIGLPVIGIDVGILKATGKHPRDVFEEMTRELAARAIELKETTAWTPAQLVSRPNKEFTRYDSLFVDRQNPDGDIIFARRTTLAVPATLIRLSPDGAEEEWIRLPSGGRVSMAHLENGGENQGYRLVWNALRHHPVFEAASVSDFTVVDLDARGRVVRRFHPVTGSRLLYPGLSPDGRYIAAVDMGRGGKNRLVVLETESGGIVRELSLVESSAAYPSWSPSGDRVVFTVRSNAGRRVAEWDIKAPQLRWLTPLSWETVRHPVYSADGRKVFYSNNTGGINGLWSVSVDTQEILHVAQRWYSASLPAASPGGQWVYFVEYSSIKGERVARTEFANAVQERPTPNPSVTDPPQALRDPKNASETIAAGNREHPESPYRPVTRAFNIHSWGLYTSRNYPNIIRLNVRSKDILGTLNWEIAALYDTNEKSPGAYMSLAYTGMRPTFYVESFYKRRGLNSENPFHEITAMAGAYFPANLSRSGLWNHKLTVGISGGAWWADTNSITPILYYRARWYRLRGGSKRALKPELGWYLMGTYAHIPLIEHYGDSITGELILYLPGGFRNTFLSLRGGIERRTANISSQLGSARGYDWLNPGLTVLTSVDYEFPLAYPDWPIGAFFYVQRFRLGIHSDFVWVGDSNALSTGGPFSRQWSSGIALTIDFAAFNSFSGMSLGMELNWRWQIQSFAFDITLEGLPIF